jgi:hypothetical protein
MQSDLFIYMLMGGDLEITRRSKEVMEFVHDQQSFDELFKLLFHHDRVLVMRAADVVEKIIKHHKKYLEPYKTQLLSLLRNARNIEVKWHIAQLIPKLPFTDQELTDVWRMFTYWARNPNESKIVRVNALQALFELSHVNPSLKEDFEKTLHALELLPVPSIQARVRKLKRVTR